MAESHYDHHHGHVTKSQHTEHNTKEDKRSYNDSDSIDGISFNNHQQEKIANQSRTVPVLVPRPNEKSSGGVQATSSFHSVSSIDSSTEMAKYFPDAQTPSLSPFRHHEGDEEQQEKSVNTSMTEVPNKTATPSKGSYATVPVATAVKQPSIQPTREPVIVPGPQQPVTNSAAPQLPAGIPSYSSQIEGLSVSQVLVNDVIVDLQTKAINESQQQYFHESTHDNFFEQASPIYIRAPNPTVILRSDLNRLRAQLRARPPVITRRAGGAYPYQQNTFQVPSFPYPRQ